MESPWRADWRALWPSRPHEDGSRIARALPEGRSTRVRYEAKKTGKSKAPVKSAVKKVGVSRKKMEKELGA